MPATKRQLQHASSFTDEQVAEIREIIVEEGFQDILSELEDRINGIDERLYELKHTVEQVEKMFDEE